MQQSPRCPICAGLEWVSIGDGRRCLGCSLFANACARLDDCDVARIEEKFVRGCGTGAVFPNWNSWRARLLGQPPVVDQDGLAYAPITLEILAARAGWLV